jgi:serpin B
MTTKLISALLAATAMHIAHAADSSGNNRFALDLYQRLAAAEPQANLFFSPYSISTALAMTYAGARGQTATEMAATLHFGKPQAEVPGAFAALEERLDAIGKGGKVTLHTANSLWFQQSFQFRKEFVETGRKSFNAEIAGADFAKDAEGARGRINKWVADKTADKIPELLKPGVLNSMTRLVLCNAIYFKGDWARQFSANATSPQDFFVTLDRKVQAPLMSQKMKVRCATRAGFSMVELPYQGGDLAMVVLLPEAKDGLQALESKAEGKLDDSSGLAAWLAALDRVREFDVVVQLPKFKLNSQFNLNNHLSALGMPAAFTPRADFSGMNGARDLFLSAVVHQAVVEVNEQGTEAAAATAVGVALSAMPPPPKVFRADHPFLFLIREKQSGAILFLGRVTDPTR